uniref:Uncharacterized protein n=1 Tax=Aegilops tauschii subsp. strangulata TaxID=200361 RepID=A0A452ZAH6_AEGTS
GYFRLQTEGDSKLAGKSGDVSVKKDALGPHGGSSGTSAQGVSMPVLVYFVILLKN